MFKSAARGKRAKLIQDFLTKTSLVPMALRNLEFGRANEFLVSEFSNANLGSRPQNGNEITNVELL